MNSQGRLNVEDFLRLPHHQEPNYLVDTAKVNRRMAKRNGNPFRNWQCDVIVPKDSSPSAFRQRMKEAIETFLVHLQKEGWELVSTLSWERREGAVDMEKGVLENCVTYRIIGTFKTNPKPMRIELPPGLVRQDPEHRITLKDAIRAG